MLNSLIGIIASSGGVTVSNSYESIATATVGAGGVGSVTFSSIPATYQHLQLRVLARGSDASEQIDWLMQLNGDGTGANYASHFLRGSGTISESGSQTAFGAMKIGVIPGSTALSNTFGGIVIDLLDYANTNKNKTIRSLFGNDLNGSNAYVGLASGLWVNTSAVNQITLFGGVSQYSQVALYGIKG
jgi:hypothetical protein